MAKKKAKFVAIELPLAPMGKSNIDPGHLRGKKGKSVCGFPITDKYTGTLDRLRCSACYQSIGGTARPSPFDVPRI